MENKKLREETNTREERMPRTLMDMSIARRDRQLQILELGRFIIIFFV